MHTELHLSGSGIIVDMEETRRGLSHLSPDQCHNENEDRITAAYAIAGLSNYLELSPSSYWDESRMGKQDAIVDQTSPLSCLEAKFKPEEGDLDKTSRSSTPTKMPHVRGAVMPSRTDGSSFIKVTRKRKSEHPFDFSEKYPRMSEDANKSPQENSHLCSNLNGRTDKCCNIVGIVPKREMEEPSEKGKFVRTSLMCADFEKWDSLDNFSKRTQSEVYMQRDDQLPTYSFPNLSEDSYSLVPSSNVLSNGASVPRIKGEAENYSRNESYVHENDKMDIGYITILGFGCIPAAFNQTDKIERSSPQSGICYPRRAAENFPEQYVENGKARHRQKFGNNSRTFCDQYSQLDETKLSAAYQRNLPLMDSNSNILQNANDSNSLGCVNALSEYYRKMGADEAEGTIFHKKCPPYVPEDAKKSLISNDASWKERRTLQSGKSSGRNTLNLSISRLNSGVFGSLNCIRAYYKHLKSLKKMGSIQVSGSKTNDQFSIQDSTLAQCSISDIPIDLSNHEQRLLVGDDIDVVLPTSTSSRMTSVSDQELLSYEVLSEKIVLGTCSDHCNSRTSTPITIPDNQLPLKKRKKKKVPTATRR